MNNNSNAFSIENFKMLVDRIENQPRPKHYFKIMANRKTIMGLNSVNPLILQLQEKLKKDTLGSSFVLYDSIAQAYMNELMTNDIDKRNKDNEEYEEGE